MQVSLQREDKLFIFLLPFIFLIYNFNLDLMPLLADEPTRAIVSLEMVLRNNFIFPTIAGDAYMNKPPLFNWIISSVIQHTSSFTEWHLRIIPLCTFFLIAIVHYIVASKEVNKSIALWSALAFLTCGRIIFYDSMMGYIDPLFSLVILLNFYWISFISRTTNYLLLYSVSYFLILLAFFLKGIPALAFQSCTLLALFAFRKKLPSLLSFSHLFGICILLTCTAIYYYEYASYHNLNELKNTLIDQSTQRTPLFNKIETTFLHALYFPIEYIIDLLPFSLLLFLCFNKTFLQKMKGNDFIIASFLFILSNIWLYWLSSETRARYLFMFTPLFFTIVFYAWELYATPVIEKYMRSAILALIGICAIAVWIIPLNARFDFIKHSVVLTAICSFLLVLTGFVLYRKHIPLFLSVLLLLLVLRLDFNLFILPLRHREAPESRNKQVGAEIAALTKDHHLFILNDAPINHDILYYTTFYRNEVVYKKTTPEKGVFYVCNTFDIARYGLVPIYAFDISYEQLKLYIARK